MKLIELCRSADIFCPSELCDVEISSVTCDSRRVTEGSLFACIKGQRSNGNDFIGEAKSAGAAAVLSDSRGDTELF